MDVTDHRAMRALAHPLRIRLLELVAVHGPITAAKCSEYVEESPSNCSFHLRTLEKYGYIERAEGDTARDRPWQIVDVVQNWDRHQPTPEGAAAASALGEAFLEWEFTRMRAAQRRAVPEEWKGNLFESGATLFLTPDESHAFGERFRELIAPYVDRLTDPALRPPEAAPVRVFMSATLAPELVEKESGE